MALVGVSADDLAVLREFETLFGSAVCFDLRHIDNPPLNAVHDLSRKQAADLWLFGGLGRKEHEHLATLELSGTLDIGDIRARFGKLLHKIVAELGVTHLATSKADRDLDLIAVSEEALSVLELGVKVVSVDIE